MQPASRQRAFRPQCYFDAQATFLLISLCVRVCESHFTHVVPTHTHRCKKKIYSCSGQILISLSDSLLALHPNGLVLHRVCI